MNKDYYSILGISKSASKEDIKRAYRKLAHKYHPDKSGGDEQKFKEASEAYHVLSDEQRRRQYDQFGSAAFSQGQSGGFGGFDFDLGDILGDIFSARGGSAFGGETVFGGGFGGFSRQGRARAQRGSDISIGIDISFKEAIFGCNRSVILQKTALCESCKGSGAESKTALKKCDTCNGTGTVRESRRSIFGFFTSLAECSMCRGRGEIPERPCKTCRGKGIRHAQETISIDVPAGIQNGEVIKLVGKGEEIPGGMAGDIYVKIGVIPHPTFRREGYDVLTDMHLVPTKMLLGGEEKLETLDGKIEVKIPELSRAGDFLRVRGKGAPKEGNTRGDLLIRLYPATPKKLSSKAKKLLKDLQDEGL